MPPSTPKAETDTVVYLEIFKGLKIIDRVALTEEYGKIPVHSSVSSGIVWSPDEKSVFWIASTAEKHERDSIMGYKVKMFEEKDYGEDLDDIYHTVIIMRNISNHSTSIIGAPKGYGVCGISSITPNSLIVRAVDLTNPVLLGLRSYTNRQYHLFAAHFQISSSKESSNNQKFEENFIGTFTKLRNEVFPEFQAKSIDSNYKKAVILGMRFPTNYGGHDGPMYPTQIILDIDDEKGQYTVSKYIEYSEPLSIASIPKHSFINDHIVLFNIEWRNLLYPVILDFNSLKLISLEFLTQRDIKNESCLISDSCNNRFLLCSGSVNHFYRVSTFQFDFQTLFQQNSEVDSLLKGIKVIELSKSELEIPNCEVELIRNENFCDAIFAKVGEGKEWIALPHGGPHGMFSTYSTFRYSLFLMAGFSVAFINFRGSTGQPFELQKALPGQCGITDVEDECTIIKMIKEKYPGSRIGHFGFSHGGFLGCHIASRFSSGENKLVEYVIVGGPVCNLISSFYSCDIPDWAMVESGASIDAECKDKVDETVLQKMWNSSPIKYIDGVGVPMLLLHGHCDRRVHYRESVQWYYAMKKRQKKVCMLIYENNGHSFLKQDANVDMVASAILFALDPLSMCE